MSERKIPKGTRTKDKRKVHYHTIFDPRKRRDKRRDKRKGIRRLI